MLINALIKVWICKTDIVHFAWTTFKVINNALFVNNLQLWFSSFEDVADFLAGENRLQGNPDLRTKNKKLFP